MLFLNSLKRPAAVIALLVVVLLTNSRAEARQKDEKVKWVRSKTGLNSLMTLSKDRGVMVRDLEGETKNYDKIARALEDDKLTQGQKAEDIIKRYGEPVVGLPYRSGELTRWVYKPYEATFFEGPKISLFFDDQGDLIRWEKREDESSGI
jgi:hypothetical protein